MLIVVFGSCGHVDEPPPEGWELPLVLRTDSSSSASARGAADVSSESDSDVSSDDDDESMEVSEDEQAEGDEGVMSATEEEDDEKFHVNPEDITFKELRTYGFVLNFSSFESKHTVLSAHASWNERIVRLASIFYPRHPHVLILFPCPTYTNEPQMDLRQRQFFEAHALLHAPRR